MIEHSEKIDQISKALLEVQPVIDIAVKNASGHHGKYADLHSVIQAVKKPLNDVGIVIIQAVDMARAIDGNPDKCLVVTTLIHAESSQWFSSNTPVYCQTPNDPQKLGSGITYAKRYGLQAMGLVPSDDDDGRAASRKLKAKKPNKKQQAFIDAVHDGLIDVASEHGRAPDKALIQRLLFEIKGGFLPEDIEKVGECVKFIASDETKLFTVTKE